MISCYLLPIEVPPLIFCRNEIFLCPKKLIITPKAVINAANRWGHLWIPQVMMKNRDQDCQPDQTDEHGAPVNPNAAHPLDQVVATCAEDKPLVTEERNCDCDNVAQHSRIEIAIVTETAEQPVQQRKDRIAKQRVESADQQVAQELRKRPGEESCHGINTVKS